MELKSITIIEQFQKEVDKNKEGIFVTFEHEAFTWKDIDLISDKVAIALLEQNVRKGAHIALCGKNSVEWICYFLAIAKVGAISVLINPNLKEHELSGIFEHADVECICYDDKFTDEKAEKCIADRQRYRMEAVAARHDFELTQESRELLCLRQKEIQTHDMAVMLFTSGTTSIPKGVLLSHYQLMNIAREATETMGWNCYDKVCLALPMFHCFGLSTGLLATLIHGGSIHLVGQTGSKSCALMKTVEDNHCTVLNGVPTLFLSMLLNKDRINYNLTSLHSGIIAGSDIHTEDFLRIVNGLNMEWLMQSYGQTEASPSITFTSNEDALELRSKSVGRKISNLQLKIINMETEEELEPFHKGEIVIKGYNVMKGYYKNEAETKMVLSSDGWLKTGDIGYLDHEGNLYIAGRKKEIIIRCGENISPKEIEEIILKNKAVNQVKVFGIPMPVVQEEIVACIECSTNIVTEDAIRDLIKESLAEYKMPKYIVVYQNFPTNATGKIDIQRLKKEALLQIQEEN